MPACLMGIAREIAPDTLEMTLTGPVGLIDDFEPSSVQRILSLAPAGCGEAVQRSDITAALLGLNPALSVMI